MSFPDSIPLQTQPFETTRRVLDTIDTYAFEPFCQVEVFASIPRIVQAAVNAIGLVDSAISTSVLCLAALAPLPVSLKARVIVWRNDAWNLTSQLADKIARLIIVAIPFIGSKMFAILDHALSSNVRLSGEIVSLRATGIVHDREIVSHLETIASLRREIGELHRLAPQREPFEQAMERLRTVNDSLEEETRRNRDLRLQLQSLSTEVGVLKEKNDALAAENKRMHTLRAATPESLFRSKRGRT